jgi:YVTN family beta-propeller protein
MSAYLLARCCRAAFVTVLVLAVAAPSSAQVFGYITDNLDRTVSVIDTTSETVVATIDLGLPYPVGVACHPDGKKVYVGGTGAASAGYVFLIDVATQSLIDTLPVGKQPQGLAVLPDGSKLYVANSGDNTVSVIDTATFTVDETVDVGTSPHGVVAHPNSSTVYVSNTYGMSVSVIDVATSTVIETVVVQAGPYGITIDPDGSFVYVANNIADSVSVIDTTTNTVVDTIIVGGVNPDFPTALAMHPDGDTLYVSLTILSVTAPPDGAVSVVDTTPPRSQTQVITGFWLPIGVAVHEDGDRLYVVESENSAVAIVDTTTNTIVDSVPVGDGPQGFGDFLTKTLIFADGFESGDTMRWSNQVP